MQCHDWINRTNAVVKREWSGWFYCIVFSTWCHDLSLLCEIDFADSCEMQVLFVLFGYFINSLSRACGVELIWMAIQIPFINFMTFYTNYAFYYLFVYYKQEDERMVEGWGWLNCHCDDVNGYYILLIETTQLTNLNTWVDLNWCFVLVKLWPQILFISINEYKL